MYKRQLLELIRVNLLYVNPQLTNKAREKGKKGKRLTIYLLSQNLFSGLIFLLIYGFAMFAMNFVKLPGFFTYYVALFGMLGLTQVYQSFIISFLKEMTCKYFCLCLLDKDRFFQQRFW